MKKILKYLLLSIGSLIGLVLLIIIIGLLWASVSGSRSARRNMALAGPEVKSLTIDNLTFRDLNKNGSLDRYEDSRCATDERVNDLLSQMNLEEKAGLMFFPPVSMKKDGSISEKPSLNDAFSLMTGGTSKMIFGKQINHFNIFTGTDKKGMAVWYNKEMITGLLRNKYHYEGVVCTDWGLLTDNKFLGMMILPTRAKKIDSIAEE